METELGIKRERAVVVSGLQQAYPRGLALCGAAQNVLHQTPAHATVLSRRIDGNRPNAGNAGSLIKEIAADDSALVFGDDRVKARMCQQSRQQTARYCWRGKVRREVMSRGNRPEGFIANITAGWGVSRRPRTKNDSHLLLPPR
jgi:hypothetical protein